MMLCAAAAGADRSVPQRAAVWPDNFVSRVEALALVQTLNADLLSHDSATETLERWCEVHRLAAPPHIVAERVTGTDMTPTPQQRLELGVSPTEPVRYRRVRLRCGEVVLSEADNWYVPSRLTPEMNSQLESTDLPFGKVVRVLHFQRHTLSALLLWSPLPAGWEMQPGAASGRTAELRVPQEILQHRATLTLQDGTPISEVVETYTRGIFAFPPPAAR
ncbi:MAG: hypothetical protein NVS9B2_15080 [Steroidobacteraceae bacterium]